jgi:hypothetical protein
VNNALILYDSTGFFNELQVKVRAEFMKPKWMAVRLNHFVDKGQHARTQLQQAVEDQDALSICHLGSFTFYLIAVPLLHRGNTPSSSRGLSQLGVVSPAMHARICELQGSTAMQPQDVLALVPICTALAAFVDRATWGQLPEYFTKKATWMAQNGQHREALNAMWLMNSASARNCQQSNDPQQISQATQVAEGWLREVDWEDKRVQTARMELAASLLEQVKALAATV